MKNSLKTKVGDFMKENMPIPSLFPLFPLWRKCLDTLDFIRQVDCIYRGLGIPTLYGTLSILANKSVFFIGGRGTGKTRIINLIPQINGTEISRWDTFTLGELNDYCCRFTSSSGYVVNEHLVFKVQEFSTLSDYHKEIFLTTCSKIVSDNNYKHVTSHTPCLDIRNCKLTLLVAIQPKLYSRLCNRYTQWESMSYDRFTKFLLLNPLRSKTVDVPLVPTLPKKNSENIGFHSSDLDLRKLVDMFKGHVSEGRAEIFAKDYAIALARFVGAQKVEQNHIDLFHQLFHPYLKSFSVLQHAKDLDSPVTVSSGCMKLLLEIAKSSDIIRKQELAERLYVTERSIERTASSLLKAGVIEKPEPAQYRLSEQLRNFFEWYKNKIGFPL